MATTNLSAYVPEIEPPFPLKNWRVGERKTLAARIPLDGLAPEMPTQDAAASALSQSVAEAEAKIPDPLYLFHCGVQWLRTKDAGAGWELVQGLRHSHEGTRKLAFAMMARTRNLGPWPRTMVPAPERKKPCCAVRIHPIEGTVGRPVPNNRSLMMNTPYGLELIDSCMGCKFPKDKWFCNLSQDAKRPLAGGSHVSSYPSGAMLFVEGQRPRGAYVLCSGKVKLTTTSRDGKVLILKVAEAGEVLGLSAAILADEYPLTAETATPCLVNFVERERLVHMIERSGEIGLRATEVLSREFQSAYRDIHDLVLARSSAGKLAKLLVSWMPNRERVSGTTEVRIRANATHEEMAQMIGSSRETVTRLLSEMKKRELIRTEGSTMVIRNRSALEAMAG